jgi:aspartyl-tRNA(Asn)/glutamyl-tRNA(Gln) amidotransferase subunit A
MPSGTNPFDISAASIADRVRRGEATAESVTTAYLETIRSSDPVIRAFVRVEESNALETARLIDAKRKRGEPAGPLAGVPVAIKDVICTQGTPTTCGSRILKRFIPPYDAHVVTRLKTADAVIIGKTNMDEFAMGSSTENSAFQVTRNPWSLERVPGGSSGGSAAAVAARFAPLALGTDTGGSIRQPASLCGTVGMKPTYGRVSRYGLVAFASSLDQIGPFGRSVADAALLLEVIAGHDSRDSTSVDEPVVSFLRTLDDPLPTLKIGIAREHFGQGLDPEVELAVREAVKVFEREGATLREISLPHSTYAIATYYLVATAEASSNLARFDGVHYGHRTDNYENLVDMVCRSRGEGFGPEVKRRIMLGTYALSSGYKDAYYLKALKVRRLIKQDFDQAFAMCDVIIGPTSPTVAFRIGEKTADPLAMYLSDIYTIGANLAGIPGISVPCGFSKEGLPIGMQILAPAFAEEKLLRAARMYERETAWHTRRPPSN